MQFLLSCSITLLLLIIFVSKLYINGFEKIEKMKNIIVAFFLLFFSFGFSQNKSCTIFLKDKTILKGYGKINDDQVKYRLDKKAESKLIESIDIEKISIESGNEYKTYYYFKIIEKDTYKWMESVVKGNVSLFNVNSSGYASVPMMNSSGGFNGVGGSRFNVDNYYLKKEGQDYVTKITSVGSFSKNFKNAASEYFKDCIELVEKIQSKYYKREDIEDVVRFYNSKCAKK